MCFNVQSSCKIGFDFLKEALDFRQQWLGHLLELPPQAGKEFAWFPLVILHPTPERQGRFKTLTDFLK